MRKKLLCWIWRFRIDPNDVEAVLGRKTYRSRHNHGRRVISLAENSFPWRTR